MPHCCGQYLGMATLLGQPKRGCWDKAQPQPSSILSGCDTRNTSMCGLKNYPLKGRVTRVFQPLFFFSMIEPTLGPDKYA